jgi:hypothetical protein
LRLLMEAASSSLASSSPAPENRDSDNTISRHVSENRSRNGA